MRDEEVEVGRFNGRRKVCLRKLGPNLGPTPEELELGPNF